MRNENFYVVQGWMISELGLSGNELICYAVIFCATQGGQTLFKESRNYLSEWMNATLPTVDRCLKSLVEKNYIVKHSENINSVTFNTYRAVSFDFITPKETLQVGGKESLAHNNILLRKEEKEIDKSISKSSKELFEECWIAYRRKGKKGKSLPYWNKLSSDEQSHVLPHIKAYVNTRDLQYQQDFERYLRDKTFNDIVYKGNIVIYDPSIGNNNVYTPATDGAIKWNEANKCYIYIGMFFGYIPDGYTDDNRPNHARIMLNNGGGLLEWDSETKKWNKI